MYLSLPTVVKDKSTHTHKLSLQQNSNKWFRVCNLLFFRSALLISFQLSHIFISNILSGELHCSWGLRIILSRFSSIAFGCRWKMMTQVVWIRLRSKKPRKFKKLDTKKETMSRIFLDFQMFPCKNLWMRIYLVIQH